MPFLEWGLWLYFEEPLVSCLTEFVPPAFAASGHLAVARDNGSSKCEPHVPMCLAVLYFAPLPVPFWNDF